ncbi:zinc-dependent alcohol dehydrogenase family protein [Rhodohalobacter mucosus]|uniref:alcohol dehydrogenase n=1 Tax=Rhodohalobacter mucosus TaxID=2079485 RepID=A0A316TMK1_9BACT|nr:zinc-dependent alcohol dehydrogenase family protein [Rhodohalobacter mucosus]PWN05650.1 alcohol dehydrogenase [Rhodohalobacter mucosus]
MKAMRLHHTGTMNNRPSPLRLEDVPDPHPEAGELLLQVSVCGVCHTELDEIEGRTPPPELPVTPGHQVIGTVLTTGRGVSGFSQGDRVGVGWIYSACGECEHCRNGNENLCENFIATGRDADGGYAEKMTVPAEYAVRVPDDLSDESAAPLLCAGAIGYRSLMLTGIENGQKLGLTGFGASGHLVLNLVKHHYPDTEVFVFARNPREREFAMELGAVWAGDTDEEPPEKLHAVIDTTPAWKPVVEALKSLEPGGRLVINAIRKEAGDKEYLENLNYERDLWMEKEIKSVANVTRRDLSEMLRLAAKYGIRPEVREFPLEAANKALQEVKNGDIRGAKVLRISENMS